MPSDPEVEESLGSQDQEQGQQQVSVQTDASHDSAEDDAEVEQVAEQFRQDHMERVQATTTTEGQDERVVRKRMMVQMDEQTNMLSYIVVELKKIRRVAEKQVGGDGNGAAADDGRPQLVLTRDLKTKATTCLRQVIGSGAWPSDGIMRKVVEQMAETPYADALRLYGLTQMASFQSELRNHHRSSTRFGIVQRIKLVALAEYTNVMKSKMFHDNGKGTRSSVKVEALFSGDNPEYLYGSGANARPYDAKPFRIFLQDAISDLKPTGFRNNSRITFLCAGHIALAEALLVWRVKHNTVNLPQNETDKEWQTFHDLHASLLLEVPRRGDTSRLKLQPLPAWLGGERCLPEYAAAAN